MQTLRVDILKLAVDKGIVTGVTDAENLLELLPNKIRSLTGILADVDMHVEKARTHNKEATCTIS